MSEYVWETLDDLFKTVNRQGRRVEELETRLADLERRLSERQHSAASKQLISKNELPIERAA